MRLINVKTFELEDFLDYKAPPYAILSHTWGDDSEELTLRDVETGRTSKPGVGSVKFQGSCRQAEKDGLGYIWIDTCCIDKTNLVELSEAINSMFRWYRNASVCYAYLSDVPARDNDYAGEPESKFRASRWFGRGWTLQELLAPKRMRFYNSAWSCLGTKGKLWTVIGEITGIPCPILLGITNLRSASVAQRMSWAAGRETKRKEDLAYCLLGIFGVTMPMIYGEGGDQAFFRLQEQIMKMTRDDSILAWGFTSNEQSSDSDPGQVIAGRALATTPSDFANSGHIVCREQSSTSLNSVEISGGNLRLYLSLLATSADNRAIGLLHCGPDHDPQLVTGIPLAKTAPGTSDEYVRPVGWHAILQPRTSTGDSPRLIYIRNDSQSRISPDASRKAWLYHAFAEVNLDLVEVNPRSCWDQDEALIISRTSSSWIMARFRYHEEESPDFLVLLEFKQQGASAEPRCHVMICRKDLSLQELARKLESVPKTAFGKESASNGLLHLSVTLKPNTEQLVFIMQPKSLSHPPEVTVDATAELQKSDITLALIKILQEKSILDTKAEDLHQTEQEEKNRLEQIKIEREKVEDELRELEERRRTLAKDESDLTENIHSLSQSQMTFIGIQEHTFGRWLVARKRWDQFWHIERDKSSYDWDRMLDRMADETPLRWAAEGGHDLIVQQLLDEGADAQARDVDGRTALSYAVERRHETVVQLLLESGQTPLGWTVAIQMAAKGNHEAILQLLGAPTDRFFKKNPKFLQAVAIGALTLAEMPSTPFSNKDLLPLSFQVAIHQQVMYCDDSTSMKREGRWEAQNQLIKRIARLTATVLPKGEGVYLQYINHEMPNSVIPTFEGLVSVLKPLSWGGDSALGTNLRSKILEPMVYSNLPNNFKRPLLISVITDGIPEPEPVDTFVQAVIECGDRLEKAELPRESVKFLIGQVGTNMRAEDFLRQLRKEPKVDKVVYVAPEAFDRTIARLSDSEINDWLIRTLYQPILKSQG